MYIHTYTQVLAQTFSDAEHARAAAAAAAAVHGGDGRQLDVSLSPATGAAARASVLSEARRMEICQRLSLLPPLSQMVGGWVRVGVCERVCGCGCLCVCLCGWVWVGVGVGVGVYKHTNK